MHKEVSVTPSRELLLRAVRRKEVLEITQTRET
jgi:hypothetical protein